MTQAAFPNVSKIKFGGSKSDNPLAFKHYSPKEIVDGKSMKSHLRFSVTYWQAFRGIAAEIAKESPGWDTDQFPANLYLTTQCTVSFFKKGGFTTGVTNLDTKVRRESFEPVDLFYSRIADIDAFAGQETLWSQIDDAVDEAKQKSETHKP